MQREEDIEISLFLIDFDYIIGLLNYYKAEKNMNNYDVVHKRFFFVRNIRRK